MQPTRQEMLDTINMKIARTSPTENPKIVKVYPVLIGDILKYIDDNCFFEKEESYDGHRSRDMDAMREGIVAVHYSFIRGQDLPLDKQDDDCISYIFNLISHE